MKTTLLAIFCVLGLATTAVAQKENNVWYFGDGAGVDFNFTPPRAITSPLQGVNEGSATYCDPVTGQLIIATDGTVVWNRDQRPMPNGLGLLGGFGTSTQGALILPFPTKKDLYYIFTCDQAGYSGPNQGVAYSVVDMTLDGGKGDVTLKNIPVFAPEMTEKLTAIPHSNGCDFWVIAHEESRNFMAILVGDTILGQPVISSVGHLVSSPSLENIGYLVSNRTGTMLAYVTEDASAWIFDFNRTTGVVSNPRTIFTTGDHLYGACFSPDGTKLYVTSYSPGILFQFDVTLPTENQIRASMKRIQPAPTSTIGAIRPGPDGKLYVGMAFDQVNPSLGIVNDPNAMGDACNFDLSGLLLVAGTQAMLGLPNVLDAWEERSMQPCFDGITPVSIDAEFGTVCVGDCIELDEVGANGRKVIWQVSDGRKFENVASPSICFDAAGDYTIQLLAVDTDGDTARSTILPVTIKPALSFELRSYAVTTDTIGAVIKVPIVLNERTDATFDASFSFDPDMLEYAGAYDDAGIPIDLGSQPQQGTLTISKQLDGDSVVGYLYFTLYWEANARCRRVTLTNYSLSNTSVRCLNTEASYEMCLDEACGTPILSQYIRTSRIDIGVMPNPASSMLELVSNYDMVDAEIVLIDADGRESIRERADFRKGVAYRIDIASLPSGVYFLAVHSPFGSTRRTIVIQR